jgi:hypothetical protein
MPSHWAVSVAIMLAALITGAAIIAAQLIPHFQIVPAVGAEATPSVWKLETRTGEIQYCYLKKDDNPFNQILENNQALVIRCKPDELLVERRKSNQSRQK